MDAPSCAILVLDPRATRMAFGEVVVSDCNIMWKAVMTNAELL